MLDPIDGTKNYVRGVPVWATLIGLMVSGERDGRGRVGARARPPVVGGQGRRRVDRSGSLTKASPCRVSEVASLAGRLALPTRAWSAGSSTAGWDGFLSLAR